MARTRSWILEGGRFRPCAEAGQEFASLVCLHAHSCHSKEDLAGLNWVVELGYMRPFKGLLQLAFGLDRVADVDYRELGYRPPFRPADIWRMECENARRLGIDRLLIAAETGRVRPVVCINKIDLVEPANLQPVIGVYSQMGYEVLILSAVMGIGIERFRQLLTGRESVVTGQSGVGKSSLLNAVDPDLRLRVAAVSDDTQKGRHTTSGARLLPLACGGYVVDTPGILQFQLWDVIPQEVAGYFRDLRPYVNLCRFPDCTHTHEDLCAVKDAVADGRLDARRYESYCQLFEGDLD